MAPGTAPAPGRSTCVQRVIGALPAIGLEDLNEHAALQDRIDVKYIVTLAELPTLIERIGAGYTALEIDGRRAFRCAPRITTPTTCRSSASTSSSAGGA